VCGKQLFVLQEVDAQLDQLREQQQMASLLMDRRHAHLESERVRAGERSHEITAGLAHLDRQRLALACTLPVELLALYDDVRRRLRMRPWVLASTGASCSACHLGLPANLRAAFARQSHAAPCPRCGRLLVRDVPTADG